MSNPASLSKISSWPKRYRLVLVALSGLVLMGQSCSISIGNTQPLDGGVWRSDDHGQTWQTKNFVSRTKKKTVTIGDVTGQSFAFRPREPQTIYLATRENGVWFTDHDGDQWQQTSLRTGGYGCLDFDPLNPDIIYVVSGTLALKSIDAGKTWKTTYTESQPGQTVSCIAVDPNRGNVIWLTTSGGKIIRSDDYGQTWTLKLTMAAFTPRRLWVDPDGSGRVYIFTQTQGIWSVEGDASSSKDLSPSLKLFRGSAEIRSVEIHHYPAATWWIATRGGLLTSPDRGATWTLIKTLVTAGSVAINTVAVNPQNSLDIFITTNQKLHHSTDGGLTWTVTTLPTARLPILLTFNPSNPDRLYFATFRPEKKK